MFFSLIFYVRKTTSKQTSGPPKDFVQNYSVQTASCVVSVAKRISSSLINNLTEPVQFRGNGLQAAPSNSQAETPLPTGLPNLDTDNNEALAQSKAMAGISEVHEMQFCQQGYIIYTRS